MICILFRREDKEVEENKQIMQDESQGSYLRSTQSTTKNSLKNFNVDVELPLPPAVEDEKQKEEKQFNDASTVVETQYNQDFNDVDTVVDTQIEPGEASSFKIGVAVPDTFGDAKGVEVLVSIYKDE